MPPTSSTDIKGNTTYTSNATNVIQNSMHLIQNKEKSNFKNYVNLSDTSNNNGSGGGGSDGDESNNEIEKTIEKENTASNKTFTVSGTASNLIVKKILDRLLTIFISKKLATCNENEVSI